MRKLLFILPLVLFCACKTPQNIAYFQDAAQLQSIQSQTEQAFRLKSEDKINIIVNSKDPTLEALFTLTAPSTRQTIGASVTPKTIAGKNISGGGVQQVIAYTVDANGNIDFPVLGTLHVSGMTRQEVAKMIKDKLIEQSLVNDAVVTVEYVNIGVSVLGDVKTPCHIDISKDHMTIVEAIAQAGDLNITGNRQNVMVIRKVDGEEKIYFVDLCSTKNIMDSPAYYLQQNDIVYVTPNDKKMRESTVSGNTLLTPAFWISVASLLTTITALIIR